MPDSFELKLLLLPVASMLIGWLTGLIIINAIRKSFRQELSMMIGNLLTSITNGSGAGQLTPDFSLVSPLINDHMDHFLNHKLKQEMPMIGMFITNKTTDKLKEIFMKEIELLFPQLTGKVVNSLLSPQKIDAIIASNQLRITSELGKKTSRLQLAFILCGFGCGVLNVILLLLF